MLVCYQQKEKVMYYDLFQSKEDVCKEFSISDFDGEVLFARYEYENYDGSAAVIFVHGGKFYLVDGGHCSCYGLEGQWEPEEITVPMMRKIADEKRSYGYVSVACYEVLRFLEEFNFGDASDELIAVTMRLRFG